MTEPYPIVVYLQEALKRAADPEKATGMQAYMKTDQKFYGVQTPTRKEIFKKAKVLFNIQSYEEYEEIIHELWEGESREEMYFALMIAQHYKCFRTDEAIKLYEDLLKSATNWDTVDLLAGNLVSQLVLNNRNHEKKLLEWRTSNNFWMRRTSLLAHLRHKERTHLELLEETILMLMHEKEFFIRKAIGWVLRDYAYTNPTWVEQFVESYHDPLSGLSQREALKGILRERTKKV
ncbi:DNA alkylation repair protein [Deltaproteobacteria bacterium TL4]